MLLYKLGRLLDQPLGLNLILTGVLSRLAQCPQPLLHMYLFGDTLNLPDLIGMHELLQFRLKRDVRTLVGVLQQVCLVVETTRSVLIVKCQVGTDATPPLPQLVH